MKIALLADVHANLPALQAVLAHARASGAEEFWNLGDMVGYAPFPNETVTLLQKTCSRNIAGNYDLKVLSEKRISKMRESGKDPDKVFSFAWTNEVLSPEARAFISTLPLEDRLECAGKRILLTHASPDGMEEGITVRTSAVRLASMAATAGVDIVLCAHTHRAIERSVQGVLFVNPGSVGRSFDKDPRAAYALLDISPRGVKVQGVRVGYDAEAMIQEMRSGGFPDRLIRSLREARSLDDLEGDLASAPDTLVRAVLDLCRECRYEKEHAHHVARLALRLFDDLRPLHALGLRERLLLQCAALLHDVGLVYGVEGHHKSSRDIILKTERVPFVERERRLVALVARYHRKGLPEAGHKYYADLSSYDREIVESLSAILRVADGLDRGHKGRVEDISVEIGLDQICLKVSSAELAPSECEAARVKGDLAERVWGRPLVVQPVVFSRDQK